MLSVTHYVLLFSVALATVFDGVVASYPPINDQDETINFLGRTFVINEKPTLSSQSTPAQIFRQCMDHTKSNGCDTKWDQRFWVRADYYKPGGPVFFQFGGEGSAGGMVDSYYWHTYAKHYNAMLIVLEHRFYGESWPSKEETIEVYQLLTSQQALADAAYFIDDFKRNSTSLDAEWVAFGCSYAANLAAWFKQKYPTYVKTAVASSGPLLAVYDFPGYLETVSDVVEAIDKECYTKIYDAFNCMESLVNGTSCGIYNSTSQIIPALQQCNQVDFGDLLDRESFFNMLAMNRWANNWPSAGVKSNCAMLSQTTGSDPMNLYGNFLVRMGQGGNCKAAPESPDRTAAWEMWEFAKSKQGRAAGLFMWYWQTCYEFGYYMSADPKHGLFGYDTFSGLPFGEICNEYGFTKEYVEERIKLTNEYYKGREIDSKCVIFVNGEWDPWHTLGINDPSETTTDNTVVFIPKAEHCYDIMDPTSDDIREAQEKIQAQIGLYLNNPNC